MKISHLLKKTLFAVFFMFYSWLLFGQQKPLEIMLRPISSALMTDSIQFAIDKCVVQGSGIVRFTEGVYFTGILQLKSNVTLQLEKGSDTKW